MNKKYSVTETNCFELIMQLMIHRNKAYDTRIYVHTSECEVAQSHTLTRLNLWQNAVYVPRCLDAPLSSNKEIREKGAAGLSSSIPWPRFQGSIFGIKPHRLQCP